MLRNILFAAAAAATVALVAITTDAMAGSPTAIETLRQHARWAAHSAAQHSQQHAAHRTFTQGFSSVTTDKTARLK